MPGPIPLCASHWYKPASDSSTREKMSEPFVDVDHWPNSPTGSEEGPAIE